MAERLSAGGPKAPILARLDSGIHSAALMRSIEAGNQPGQPQVNWMIKWNPRGVDTAALLARLDAQPGTLWHMPRQDKRVAVWEQAIQIEGVGRPLRRVLRLVERDIDCRRQHLIAPEVALEGRTTILSEEQFNADKIIVLYADHGTHEQFRSEFKTDLDLERLPSGKFDTDYLVWELAALAMDILRLKGQRGLLGPDAPVRHPRQATQDQDGDAGAHLPRGAADRSRKKAGAGTGRQRPSGQGIRPAQRRAFCGQELKPRCLSKGPRTHGSENQRFALVGAWCSPSDPTRNWAKTPKVSAPRACRTCKSRRQGRKC
jgi:hypothetical protein